MPKIFDFDEDWIYHEPRETHQKFREYLDKLEPNSNKEYTAQLLTQLARTQSLQHNWEQAYNYLEEAKNIIDDSTPVAKIRYCLELGRTYNSSGKKEEAKSEFLIGWEEAQKQSEDNYAIDAAHMMAIAESDPDVQINWNEKGIALAEKSEDPNARKWLGSLYNNTAWSYFDKDKLSEAMNLFDSALKLRLETGDPLGIAIARWTIGRTQRAMSELDQALITQMQVLNSRIEHNLGPGGYNHEELFEIYLAKGNELKAKENAKIALELLVEDKWFMKDEHERHARLVEYSS